MTEVQRIESQSEQPIVESDFQNANAIIDSIGTPKDSQPTKLKVKNFKNRVFHLLKIYTAQTPNVNPLIQCLKQEMFFRQPEKMQQLLHTILNKQNVTLQNLQQLTEYYKVILLYKGDQKSNDSIAPEFVRLVKKLSTLDQAQAHDTVLGMLKAFAYERKCKLNINFFFYFFRKYQHPQQIRKLFIQKLNQFLQDQKLRNAQKKQLSKILQRLDKTTRVKTPKVKHEQDQQDQNDDDIKATNKKVNGLNKVKKIQGEESNKIQEQGKQGANKKSKKQVSVEQQQKLQRIKQNKKKNRKQNQNQNQNHQPNQDKSSSLQKDRKNQKNTEQARQRNGEKPHSVPKSHQNNKQKGNDKRPQNSKNKPQNKRK